MTQSVLTFAINVNWPNYFFIYFPYFFLKYNIYLTDFCPSSNIDPPYYYPEAHTNVKASHVITVW
jgi:hypothetical protein